MTQLEEKASNLYYFLNCKIVSGMIKVVEPDDEKIEAITQYLRSSYLDGLRRGAEIAGTAPEKLTGGNWGGPESCEYECSYVIEEAILAEVEKMEKEE